MCAGASTRRALSRLEGRGRALSTVHSARGRAPSLARVRGVQTRAGDTSGRARRVSGHVGAAAGRLEGAFGDEEGWADMRQAGKVARMTKRRVTVLAGETDDAPDVRQVRELTDAEHEREAIEAEPRAVLEDLAMLHAQRVQNYCEYSKGMHGEDGHKLTDREIADRAYSDASFGPFLLDRARKAPLREVTWKDLAAIAEVDPAEAVEKWAAVKQLARGELASGVRCAEMGGAFTLPYQRAQFIVIHEQLEEGWKPQNGIEHSLIDMLALSYSLFLYWTQIAHARAVGEAVDLFESERKLGGGSWTRPIQDVADSIEQAQRLADGYHRQYMRTLRQMRDLRRYAPPVIVNNGGQVNVASQQVNVTSVP